MTFIVNNDQPLVVVGDITSLGDWNPSRGTVMNNDPLGSPQWVCSVWLTKIIGNIQFKFVQVGTFPFVISKLLLLSITMTSVTSVHCCYCCYTATTLFKIILEKKLGQ